jgi:hypothetical protein
LAGLIRRCKKKDWQALFLCSRNAVSISPECVTILGTQKTQVNGKK